MRRSTIFALLILCLAVVPAWGKAHGKVMKSIGREKVNVRSGPGLNSDVLFQAHLGYPLQVTERRGDWVRFTDWMGNRGWVYRPLLSDIQTVVVMKENVNVRRGPGLRNPVVTKVDKGEVYKVFGRSGEWVKIGYYMEREEIGWIRGDLVWGN
jgi:uncharacterized protein YgiM (DUF1202 family)